MPFPLSLTWFIIALLFKLDKCGADLYNRNIYSDRRMLLPVHKAVQILISLCNARFRLSSVQAKIPEAFK